MRVTPITEQTHYRWKANSAAGAERKRRPKTLEDENRRLKQIVAEQTLDTQALKTVGAQTW